MLQLKQLLHSITKSYNINTNNYATTHASESDRTFHIQLPKCGTYSITVVARGTDNSCFTCCQQGSITIPNVGTCGSTENGTPRFRVVSTQINASLQAPPPSKLYMKPLAENCSNCGC